MRPWPTLYTLFSILFLFTLVLFTQIHGKQAFHALSTMARINFLEVLEQKECGGTIPIKSSPFE